ncbi:MAG: M23 family metallopeptidase [Bacteroidales bacterium]
MKRNIFFISIISLLSLLSVIHFAQTTGYNIRSNAGVYNEQQEEPQPNLEYGMPVDSFEVSSNSIKRNQTLGSIFRSLNIDGKYISQLGEQTRDVFDIRKIKAGNLYKVFTARDTAETVTYFVYEDSQVDYVVFHFTDSLRVTKEQHDIVPVTKISEAEISSSLWEAMSNYNLPPMLALDLSEIFAWTVDFFGLFKGDKFKVIYDELYVDDKSVGIGTIHAAWFEHRGDKFYAFRFMQDSTWSYWDEEGNSLKRSFLKAPLRFSRISSKFTHSRFHPILKVYRPHTGVDYAAPSGTPVVALGDGIVVAKGYGKAAGNYVKIRHNSVYTTGYNHFSRFGKGIRKGAKVKQGQVIGYVGSTGYSTGPHLDLRFWKNGKPIDPLKVEAPPVEPINEEKVEKFRESIALYQIKLDSISLRPAFPSQNAYASF